MHFATIRISVVSKSTKKIKNLRLKLQISNGFRAVARFLLGGGGQLGPYKFVKEFFGKNRKNFKFSKSFERF